MQNTELSNVIKRAVKQDEEGELVLVDLKGKTAPPPLYAVYVKKGTAYILQSISGDKGKEERFFKDYSEQYEYISCKQK